MIKAHNKAFGVALSKLRIEKGFTQEQLGFETELTRTYISLLERGIKSPTLDTLAALCKTLKITLATLARQVEIELVILERGNLTD